MDRIVQLSKLKLNTSKENVLEKFLEKDKPILIEIPADKAAVLIKLGIKEHDSLRLRQMRYMNHNKSCSSDKQLSVFDCELLDNVEYVQLSREDIILLKKEGRCKVGSVKYFFKRTNSGMLELENVDRMYFNLRLKTDIKKICENKGFTNNSDYHLENVVISFSTRKSSYVNKDGVIDLVEERLSISLDSIFAFENDVKEFVLELRDLIPEDSPYFIKPELRGMSDLDQLAEIAAKYCGYGAETNVKTSDLARKITAGMGYKGKKADVAAFFIQPNPRGKLAKGATADSIKVAKPTAPDCQFPYLVYALETYEQKPSHSDGGQINSDIVAFLERLGFATDNAKYGEMFVRKKLRGVN